MKNESIYVLKAAGVSSYEGIYDGIRQSTIRLNEKQKKSTNYQDYYKDLDEKDVEMLTELYSFDIYLFSYPKSPFIFQVKP